MEIINHIKQISEQYQLNLKIVMQFREDYYHFHVFAEEEAAHPIEGSDMEMAYAIGTDYADCLKELEERIKAWEDLRRKRNMSA